MENQTQSIQKQSAQLLNQATLLPTSTVREIEAEYVGKVAGDCIAFAFAFQGQPLSKEDLRIQLTLLTDQLLTAYKSFRLYNLKPCFEMGLRREFGDFYGLNTGTFIQWINGFISKEKAATGGRLNSERIKAEKKPEPTPEEKEIIFLESLGVCHEKWKRTGQVVDLGGAIFDGLWKRKQIQLTQEQIENYKILAADNEIKRLSSELQAAKDKIDRPQVVKLTAMLDEILPNSSPIKIEAKRLALADYFTSNL